MSADRPDGPFRTWRLVAWCAVFPALVLLGAGSPSARSDEDQPVARMSWMSLGPDAYSTRTWSIETSEPLGTLLDVTLPLGEGVELGIGIFQNEHEVRVLVDRDLDGHWLDEEVGLSVRRVPEELESVLPGRYLREGPPWCVERIPVPWAAAAGLDEGVPVHFELRYSSYGIHELAVTILLHRVGQVVLAGRLRDVAVFDGNGDLRFDDPDADPLYLDVDGDLRLRLGDEDPERVSQSVPFRLRSRAYRAQVLGPYAEEVYFLEAKAPEAPPAYPPRTELPDSELHGEGPVRPLAEVRREYEADARAVREGRKAAHALLGTIWEAGRVGTPKAFAFLKRVWSRQKSQRLRRGVLQAMGDPQFVAHEAALGRLVKSCDGPVLRAEGLAAFHRMGGPGRLAFYEGLARSARDLDGFAAVVPYIGYLRTPEARDTLRTLVKKHRTETEWVDAAYRAATRAWGAPPDEEWVALAVATGDRALCGLLLEDASWAPANVALAAIRGCRPFAEADDEVRLGMIEVLGARGTGACTGDLLELAPWLTKWERRRAVRLLAASSRPGIEEAVAVRLKHRDAAIRRMAAELAAHRDGSGIAEAVRERVLGETDPDAQCALAAALCRHDDADASRLFRLLESETTRRAVRRASLHPLVRRSLGNPDVARRLVAGARRVGGEFPLDLIEAAGSCADARSAPLLVPWLEDEAAEIRQSAARNLGRARAREAVPPLIEALAFEPDPTARPGIADALLRTTGQPFGEDVDLWRRWWAAEGESFEVPSENPERNPRARSDRYFLQARFYGIRLIERSTVFVIDRSQSMSEGGPDGYSGESRFRTKLDSAIREMDRAVSRMRDGIPINVVFFASEVEAWAAAPLRLSPRTRVRLGKYASEQVGTGETNLWGGLAAALLMPDVEQVCILSDGAPTAGRFLDRAEIVEAAMDLAWNRGITIHAVAIGEESPLLRALAARTGGQYARR